VDVRFLRSGEVNAQLLRLSACSVSEGQFSRPMGKPETALGKGRKDLAAWWEILGDSNSEGVPFVRATVAIPLIIAQSG